MKVPLANYEAKLPGLKVFSYIIELPFTPIDIDIRRLVEEFGWGHKVDRFRIWNIGKIPERTTISCPYLIIRKIDREKDVMLFCRIDFNPNAEGCLGGEHEESHKYMAISILCNDDQYAEGFLSLLVNLPPSYRSKEDFEVVRKSWVRGRGSISKFQSIFLPL